MHPRIIFISNKYKPEFVVNQDIVHFLLKTFGMNYVYTMETMVVETRVANIEEKQMLKIRDTNVDFM